ncbi:MAG TPA: radical SAM protein [Phycisphaerae bacterium]|nr:radical SAM protein [Phycisphaerae bacterium]
MRVLLIQPPHDLFEDDERQAMPPLGLAYIAAVLEQQGHEVRILDCVVEGFDRLAPRPDGRRRHGLGDESIREAVAAYRPVVVGVSCLFSAQTAAAHHVCRLAKEVDPEIVTVMGGAHPSAVPEEVLADPAVDACAIGEGEKILANLVRSLERGGFPPTDLAGLAVRVDGRVLTGPPAPVTSDLDALPAPARHLLRMREYFRHRSPHGAYVRRHPVTNLITSRGCPAKCSFCSIHTVWGRRFRWHSADRVLGEMEQLIERYGVRELQFEDDNLTLHKPRMRAICRGMIDRRLDLTWTTPNGAAIWALDEELVGLMREAGCHHLTLAVESGSPRVLRDIIRKPLDLSRVRPIVRACRAEGIGISVFFVVGFPGETGEEIRRTFDFAMSLDVDQACFFTATPYPGTELFRQCVEQGLLRPPVDYATLRVGRPVFDTPQWSARELAEMTRAAQARFYRRTALRRPIRFFAAAAAKFAREPRVTLAKARDTLLPRRLQPGPT